MCYPWLNVVYNQILHLLYMKKKQHYALILDSKWDVGEDVLVDMLVHGLMCNNLNATKFCNICHDCYLINSKNHPNYFILDIEEDMQSIGVDAVRSCISSIYQCMRYSNKIKIIFVKYVEYLTNQAINVILKVLEEPPVNTYFFLKTRKYMQLPKTLLSRCVKWSIVPPIESLGLKWLQSQQQLKLNDKLSVVTALRLCNGSPLLAKEMLKSNRWENRLFLCKSVSDAMIKKNFLKILSSLNTNRYDNIPIYWLITLLMDALKLKQGVQKQFLINLDQLKLINVISTYYNIISLNYQLQKWMTLFCYFQKFDNINRKLWLVYRLLNWNYDIIEDCVPDWSI